MRSAPVTVAALSAIVAGAGASAAASEPLPETTITSGPSARVIESTVSFGFSSDRPDAGFECRLDGGTWTLREPAAERVPQHVFDPRWEPCSSPAVYRHLEDGSHVFEVRAVSPGGATDSSPATRSFVVDASIAAHSSARSVQRQPRRRVRVELRVRAEEPIEVSVRGALAVERRSGKPRRRLPLRERDEHLVSGEAITLRLRPRRAAGLWTARALRRGRRANANLRVRIENRHGSSRIDRRLVRLKSRRR